MEISRPNFYSEFLNNQFSAKSFTNDGVYNSAIMTPGKFAATSIIQSNN